MSRAADHRCLFPATTCLGRLRLNTKTAIPNAVGTFARSVIWTFTASKQNLESICKSYVPALGFQTSQQRCGCLRDRGESPFVSILDAHAIDKQGRRSPHSPIKCFGPKLIEDQMRIFTFKMGAVNLSRV